jgi:hypothetical protein
VRLITGALVILTALVGVALPVAASGPAPVQRCNGSAELCDRTLGDVVFATSHNSMSAPRHGFRGPNQDLTIAEQLEAGVRGFQIDAYPGIRTGNGIYTDLPAAVEQRRELPRALLAVGRRLHRQLRPGARDREPGVFLCHTLCELGAMPMSEYLDELRTFLAEHPDDVVMIVVEDYVPPEQLRQAFDEAGLTSMLLPLAAGTPLPTLREMIASGRRIAVTLENGDGGPTMPNAFAGLVEETPFHFTTASALSATDSCRPNRGVTPAPIDQLNHWVTPPRRVRGVNDERLRERVAECIKTRGRTPTLLAVDFVGDSELFELVDELNEAPASVQP